MGGVVVGGRSQSREEGDRQHINVAELRGAHKALQLVALYEEALGIEDQLGIKPHCDEESGIAWLNRPT